MHSYYIIRMDPIAHSSQYRYIYCVYRWRQSVSLPVTSLGNDLRTRYDDDVYVNVPLVCVEHELNREF